MNQEKKYDVFISYSQADRIIADSICTYLEQHHVRCFIDYRDIPKGERWAVAISEALRNSQLMIAVFSKDYNLSEQTDNEVTIAANRHIPILTFRLTDIDFNGLKEYFLTKSNWIDAFPEPEKKFGDLLKWVERVLNRNDVFISYSRKDRVIADEICNAFNQVGITYFIDRSGILSGEQYTETIIPAIKNARFILYLMSENSSESTWTWREISYAEKLGKRIIPIKIDNSPISEQFLFEFPHLQIIDAIPFSIHSLLGKLEPIITNGIKRTSSDSITNQSQIQAIQKQELDNYTPKSIDIDIFISYRRIDGRDQARNIMQGLKLSGYPKVFFDYKSIRDGVFNTQILDAIYSCNDFILLLTPLAMKNCSREDDWVAREIRTAFKYNKKIIPIVIENTFPGWPDDFPRDMNPIKDIQFHKLLIDEYFEDSIKRLAHRLSTPKSEISYSLSDFEEPNTSPIPQTKEVLYKVKVDRECHLYIDDEFIKTVSPSIIHKIPMASGQFFRKFVDVNDETIFNEGIITVGDNDIAENIVLNS